MPWLNNLAAATALAASLAACTQPGTCTLRTVADMPTLTAKLPLVSVLVGNHIATLLVDTGATNSLLANSLLDAEHLPREASNIVMVGVGGVGSRETATIPTLTLGNATAHDVTFFAVPKLELFGPGVKVDGLFGADFLANYDVMIDLPAHHLAIYERSRCADDFQPFKVGAYSVRMRRGSIFSRVIAIKANLDGTDLPFIVDSGAARSYLTTRDAVRLGLTSHSLAGDARLPVTGLGDRPVTARLHTFKSLALDDIHVVSNPMLAVYPGPMNVIGDDFLQHNRIWISYRTDTLFIQPTNAE